jgi:hypothetical protein
MGRGRSNFETEDERVVGLLCDCVLWSSLHSVHTYQFIMVYLNIYNSNFSNTLKIKFQKSPPQNEKVLCQSYERHCSQPLELSSECHTSLLLWQSPSDDKKEELRCGRCTGQQVSMGSEVSSPGPESPLPCTWPSRMSSLCFWCFSVSPSAKWGDGSVEVLWEVHSDSVLKHMTRVKIHQCWPLLEQMKTENHRVWLLCLHLLCALGTLNMMTGPGRPPCETTEPSWALLSSAQESELVQSTVKPKALPWEHCVPQKHQEMAATHQ